MAGLKNRSENKAFQSVEHIEKYITSISVSNFKTNIPRVNLRRIKLNKFQNLFTDFESKSIAQLYLDKIFLESNLLPGKTESETAFEEININPLRKKQAEDEKPPLIEAEENAVANEPVLKLKIAENKRDVTFNLEAQIVREDENVLLSPAFPSAPKTQDDLVSSSGEQAAFIWPPNLEKKIIKKTKPKKLKKRPYFLSGEGKPLKQPEEKLKATEPRAGDIAAFPWALTGNDDPTAEEMFKGGLELELLDAPEKTEVKEPVEQKTEVPFSGAVAYKALFPNVPFESLPENIINDTLKNIGWFSKLLDKFNNLEFGIVVTGKDKKKVGKMFEKFGYKFTPIRIIILGGAVATIGYSIWNYLLPIINSSYSSRESGTVVVKNLFKAKNMHTYSGALTDKKSDKLKPRELLEEKSFSPITEEERQTLIQMARESLENRLDPFGQEAVLPKEVIQQKMEEQADTGPKEIPVNRKQLELVGVISANNKNLALVNIYNADYTVTEDDDKPVRDSKLKTALSMAVPNRLEVSLLDPVDKWYVKQIIKGKAKGEDPVIVLVKGDKKFKLKVGQKVLLPEEKKPAESDTL
ncbi:MAG: hypothetical protein A3I68_08315 [Candidatus Melainabacteria bacterium RIFCSPLOWO2_02_FULL_35_15]|nr:MAG: hypothetical protein A3I68_08315 [Candidatus Melainabacteria bacterium RIFCSPLOWO2_02_FULL_35_15]